MKKLLILVHRYLGIAIGLLMVAWCLSGLVMMYVDFPALDERERISGLMPLRLDGCCNYEAALASVDKTALRGFAVEMLAGVPVLRLSGDHGEQTLDLVTGQVIGQVSPAQALALARDSLAVRSVDGVPRLLDRIDTDQWTVTGAYNAHRPMYRIALDDAGGTRLYIAANSGRVVLDTTAKERFWNWFGAVTHWLYPSILRQHGTIWTQVVIWTSVLGTFLTLIGLWLGVLQMRVGRSRALSPYRGWHWWHHVSGLVFGVLLLAWVSSGLLSMNPWGLLAGTGARAESDRLRGVAVTGADAVAALRAVANANIELSNVRQIASAPFAGKLYLLLQARGATTRLEAGTLAPAVLTAAQLRRSASQLNPGERVASAALLPAGDAYHYDALGGGRGPAVYRVILDDRQRTRYYIDPATGRLLQKTDRDGRWYRWLFQALHSWDWPGLRHRTRDLVVIPLMLGVTGLALTGVYLGFRRVAPGSLAAAMEKRE